MEERQQWLSMAAVILVIFGLGVFLYRQSRNNSQETQPEVASDEQQAQQGADSVLDSMNVTLPEGAERANLRDVSDEVEGAGVTTKTEQGSGFLVSALASLPEPEAGTFYEVYLSKADASDGDEPMFVGRLVAAKGGWKVERSLSAVQVEGYDRVMITREKTNDQQPEEVILEGDFN